MSNYHCYLTNHGYLLKTDQMTPEQIKKTKDELTFQPKICQALKGLMRPNKFLTYKESPSYLFVPRFYGIQQFGQPVKTLLPNGTEMHPECQIASTYSVRSHQLDAYQKTVQQLKQKGGGILSVFCGWGKTFMAIYLAVQFHGKTLVLIHKEDLFDQWRGEILHFTGGRASIGTIQQNKVDVEGHDFVLAMIPSLSQRNYPADIFKGFRLLIVDECHHIGSETFSRTLDKTAFKYTLGLSATPVRKDGLTTVFTNYLGPIFHIEKRSGRKDALVLRLPLVSNGSYYSDQYFVNGTRNTAKMVVQLTEFTERNRLIIKLLEHILLSENSPELRKVLILSNSRNHLASLYQLLKELQLERDGQKITFGYYWGLASNGETGLQEKCLAPIPEIIKNKKGLSLNREKRQSCIFNQLESSYYCRFHQYLSEQLIGFNDYLLCQQCDNYFIANPIDNQTNNKLCPICQDIYQFTSNSTNNNNNNNKPILLELIKGTSLKTSTKKRYKEMLEDSKKCDIILGTNGIASEALNIPGLNTLIQGTPQQEVEQTVGRILRKQSVDSNNPPLIIDLIDHCGNFVNHSRTRLKIYKNEGFIVKTLAKLDMDSNPLSKFNWEYFDRLVHDHSFGQQLNDKEQNIDSDGDDSDNEPIKQCLL